MIIVGLPNNNNYKKERERESKEQTEERERERKLVNSSCLAYDNLRDIERG